MKGFRLTVRSGPRVKRVRFPTLDEALAELTRRGKELEASADARVISPPLMKDFDPVQQVTGRIQLAGPGRLRAGVDIRGDGSSEAWTGRIRRDVIKQRKNESAYDALRRALR